MNRGIDTRSNVVERTMASRLRDFVSMNPPMFVGYMVEKDPI